jgi:uncharacterized protein YegP (UPF0339 family)
MAGKFVLKKTKVENFVFNLVASNTNMRNQKSPD